MRPADEPKFCAIAAQLISSAVLIRKKIIKIDHHGPLVTQGSLQIVLRNRHQIINHAKFLSDFR